MSTLPARTVRRQRQSTPTGPATSRTVQKGEVVPAPHGWAWLRRPDPRPHGWANGLLLIDGTPYDAGAQHVDDEHGYHWLVVDLKKTDGTTYRLCLGHGACECDCAHSVYRKLPCKHSASLQAAIAWLDDREHQDWLDAVDASLDPVDAPF